MVYTPRRRRLFRAIIAGVIFAGCLLLFERWNSGNSSSKFISRISKYGQEPLGSTIHHKIQNKKQDGNVTKVLDIHNSNKIFPTTKKRNITWIQHPWIASLRGFLNVHVWLDWCGSTVSDLRRNIHFPKYPDVRLKSKLFHLSHDAHNFGQRVFGFLHPPKTGLYRFAISSDDSSELWLSPNNDPNNARLIAWVGNLSNPFWQGYVGEGEFTKYKSQVSEQIFLRRNRLYFVEALHKQSTSRDHLLVAWKIPRVGNFSHITRGRISQYIHPHELHNLDVTRYARHIPLTPAVLRKPLIPQKLKDQILMNVPEQNSKAPLSSDAYLYRRDDYPTGEKDKNDRREDSPTVKKELSAHLPRKPVTTMNPNLKDFIYDSKLQQSIAQKLYPSCEYNPSYRVNFKVARYEGIYLIHETAVYPDDGTHFKHVEYYKPCYEMRSTDSHGEILAGVDFTEFAGNEMHSDDAAWKVEAEGDRKTRDSNEITDSAGIIVTVNYTDLRRPRDSVLKSNFSTGRKILAAFDLNSPRKSSHTRDNFSQGTVSHDETLDSLKHKLKKRVLSKANVSDTQARQNIAKDRSHFASETSEKLRENMRTDVVKNRLTNEDGTEYQVRIIGLTDNMQGDFPVIKQGHKNEVKLWHRKRYKTKKTSVTEDIFVDDMSPLGLTMRKLKESGEWEEIVAYAKRNKLLLTKKTWMYVTWKFLRYEKPKKPHDKLVEFVYKQNPPKCRTDGNILLNEKVAKGVVNRYMKDVRKKYGSEVFLSRIMNVEENHDIIKGDRYLIELELGLNNKNKTIHVSDYVYFPLDAQSFCSPRDFVWRRNVTVHVIVPVKDQGKWVQHFINDMSELYETTQDANMNVIIVDFNSSDIDIEEALKKSSLQRYRFLQVNGSFQRALGVQIGADAVENPDDIIFTCDLHLDIPNNMIDILRKHCIQGKMAFSPMVLRLECGFTPELAYGEWETMGYGLFAIYKSDYDRIGGMNIDEFKTKWGGEDWEMVDRCLQKGMEIERLRVPNFYHYFHSKQGMWGSYGFEDNVSGDIGDSISEDKLVPVYSTYADNVMTYNYNQPLMPEY